MLRTHSVYRHTQSEITISCNSRCLCGEAHADNLQACAPNNFMGAGYMNTTQPALIIASGTSQHQSNLLPASCYSYTSSTLPLTLASIRSFALQSPAAFWLTISAPAAFSKADLMACQHMVDHITPVRCIMPSGYWPFLFEISDGEYYVSKSGETQPQAFFIHCTCHVEQKHGSISNDYARCKASTPLHSCLQSNVTSCPQTIETAHTQPFMLRDITTYMGSSFQRRQNPRH